MRSPRLSIGLGSFLVALALVVAVGIGSAIAVIPNNGTYSACLTKATGEIRVVNYPKVKCTKGERLIRWSQQGPAGPQGPAGAQGDQGPAGPADWNAIGNKPAGFADGVDDVGYTSVTQAATYSVNGFDEASVIVDHPIGTDAEVTIIPQADRHLGVTDEYFYRGPTAANGRYPDLPDGTLRRELVVKNEDFDTPVTFKVRVRVYNTGIAPTAFKKALKRVEVGVVAKASKKRR